MIKFSILGSPVLNDSAGNEIGPVLAQPKRLALLAFLALAEREDFLRRDTLLAMFWPDSDEERARTALRQAIRFLRSNLGDDIFITRGNDEIGLNQDRITCDVRLFFDALKENNPELAFEYYRGDLLPGLIITGCSDFEDWLSERRNRMRVLASSAALRAGKTSDAAGNLPEAVVYVRRSHELTPGDESILQYLLSLLDRSGNRSAALRVYEHFSRKLREDFDADPSPETTALINRISSRKTGPESVETTHDPTMGETDPQTGEETGTNTPGSGHSPEYLYSKQGTVLPGSKKYVWLFLVAILSLPALILFYFFYPASENPSQNPRRVVVAVPENLTGQSIYDPVGYMAADWITLNLTRTGFLEVVPYTSVLVSSRPRPGTPGLQNPSSAALRLATETGAGTVITGTYYLENDLIYFHARILDMNNNRVLKTIGPESASVTAPLEAISELGKAVLTEIAPLLDPRGTHVQVAMSPPSYESYLAYMEGLQYFIAGNYQECVNRLKYGSGLDPSYVLPRLVLAICHANRFEWDEADSLRRQIEAERERLGPFEKVTLDHLSAWISGDFTAAWQAGKKAAALTPGSIPEYGHGQEARRINRLHEANRVFAGLNPDHGELREFLPYWLEKGEILHMLGKHMEELETARQTVERFPNRMIATYRLARAYAAAGNPVTAILVMERAIDTGSPSDPYPADAMINLALELSRHGAEDLAGKLFVTTLEKVESEWVKSGISYTNEPGRRYTYARILHLNGRFEEAISLLGTEPDDVYTRINFLGFKGLLLAESGNADEAERVARLLRLTEEPWSFGQEFYWLAVIAAATGQKEEALLLFRESISRGNTYGAWIHISNLYRHLEDYEPFQELLKPADREPGS
jgi:DNA-binding SARP family transcriptional activator/tetratricopeptide (TPR) repeat protein